MTDACVQSNLTVTRTGVPELGGPALVRLTAIDKKSAYYFLNITVYWSSSWATIVSVQDKIEERTKNHILNVYSSHHHCRCWPTFIKYLPTMYLVQRMSAYPQNFGSMLGQRRSPSLVQCRLIVYNAGPTIIHHRVCCILCANMWHSPKAVLMLTHSLQRCPDIETALGDCIMFSDCYIVMWVPLSIPVPEKPHYMIHWPNTDVMLGHRLRRWANIIPTKTP